MFQSYPVLQQVCNTIGPDAPAVARGTVNPHWHGACFDLGSNLERR